MENITELPDHAWSLYIVVDPVLCFTLRKFVFWKDGATAWGVGLCKRNSKQ